MKFDTFMGKPYRDLINVPEDERIRLIAQQAKAGKVLAVMVDDEPGKVARYRRKLVAAGCQIITQVNGPVKGVVTLEVRTATPA